jgi:hypothetical protein
MSCCARPYKGNITYVMCTTQMPRIFCFIRYAARSMLPEGGMHHLAPFQCLLSQAVPYLASRYFHPLARSLAPVYGWTGPATDASAFCTAHLYCVTPTVTRHPASSKGQRLVEQGRCCLARTHTHTHTRCMHLVFWNAQGIRLRELSRRLCCSCCHPRLG